MKDPEPLAEVAGLGDSSVDLTFRTWVKQDDYWDIYFHMHKHAKLAMDQNGITIPFPQRDVHIFNETKP